MNDHVLKEINFIACVTVIDRGLFNLNKRIISWPERTLKNILRAISQGGD